MNNLKRIVITMSAAFSILGASSIAMASSCPTSVSPSTATCLSDKADQTFQSNYQTEYAKQISGLGNSSYSPADADASAPQQEAVATPTPDTNKNNNNDSNKSSIHWF